MEQQIWVEIDAAAAGEDALVELGRWWFKGVLTSVAPELAELLEEGGFRDYRTIQTPDDPLGRPGGAWGQVVQSWSSEESLRVRQNEARYSRAYLDRTIEGLARRPMDVTLRAAMLDDRGLPRPDLAPIRNLHVSLRIDQYGFTGAQLLAQVDTWRGLQPAEQDLCERRWVDFFTSVADRCDVTYGQIGWYDSFSRGTPLEAALPNTEPDHGEVGRSRPRRLKRTVEQGLRESNRWLRGYGWMTVVGEQLARRLGGAESLAASGGFAQVQPLRYGGVLLKATSSFSSYDRQAASAVHRALAPVLPPGTPDPALLRADSRFLPDEAPDFPTVLVR